MNNIIEKLGITPGHYETRSFDTPGCNHFVDYSKDGWQTSAVPVESQEMKHLKDCAPELLEALIEHAIHYEKVTSVVPKKTVLIIEKCDPKHRTWEQIRELVK